MPGRLYGLNRAPMAFLIDPEGRMVDLTGTNYFANVSGFSGRISKVVAEYLAGRGGRK